MWHLNPLSRLLASLEHMEPGLLPTAAAFRQAVIRKTDSVET